MYQPSTMATLNTKKIFVRGITKSGCLVYMPINFTDTKRQQEAKKRLQDYLDSQPSPPNGPTGVPDPQIA